MSSKKTASAPRKIVKAEASRARADGPVAKARDIFAKMPKEVQNDSGAVIAACEKAGINRGTATVQLGRWRKENKIVVQRGGLNKKVKPAETKPAPKVDKKTKPAPKADPKPKPAAKKVKAAKVVPADVKPVDEPQTPDDQAEEQAENDAAKVETAQTAGE